MVDYVTMHVETAVAFHLQKRQTSSIIKETYNMHNKVLRIKLKLSTGVSESLAKQSKD